MVYVDVMIVVVAAVVKVVKLEVIVNASRVEVAEALA